MIENMDPLTLGAVVGIFTLIILFSGIPIAFGLCVVSLVFLVAAEGVQIIEVYAETFYSGINSFILLSIPMFILMGMAVANSPAGKDLYTGLDRWLWRVPGGLVISNIGACAVFAALSGSSPSNMCCHWNYGNSRNEKKRILRKTCYRMYRSRRNTRCFNSPKYCFNCLRSCDRYIYWKIISFWCGSRFYVGKSFLCFGRIFTRTL